MRFRALFLFLALLVATALGVSCSASSGDESGTGASSSTGGNNSGTGSETTGTGFNTGGGNNGQMLVIEPATFDLTVQDGAIVTQPLVAKLNGQDVTAQVQWAFEKPLVGDVVGGVFTPSGSAGGSGVVTATLGNTQGQAIANVYVKKTLGVANVTPDQKTSLDNPMGGADPSMQMLYPYDQTVFPLDVLAPEIMWNGGQGADVYKLTIVEKYYEYTEYFASAPPSRHLIAEDDWKAIAESGSGAQSDPVTVNVTRWSGGTAYSPNTRTWRIAQGRLKGVVYYWELPDACPSGNGNGRILRVKPSSPTPEEFYQPGGCWGCHTVSRDGGKMMATLDSGSPFPQVTIDLTTDPATPGSITAGSGLGGTFSAYNHDGTKVLVSNDGAGIDQLRIADTVTGQILNGNALGDNCAEPAWSPDGKHIAAICGVSSGGWAFDSSIGNLTLADVGPDGFSISNQQAIVPQGSPGRPAYPSFTPGSEWIAFGRPTAGSRSTGQGTLWLTNLAGTEVKQLTNLGSDNSGLDNRSFNPVFAPLRAGGYYWLVFISRRDYGNRLVGSNRQQLWVGAITDPPTDADPSQKAFYLRGQEDCGKSENAYFALEPCKQIGDSCTSGVDCCEGTCVKDPNTMEYVCGVPGDCAADGNACTTDGDCCDAPLSTCVDGFCQKPPPQ
ncbi:MAG: hypothetical protein JNL21_10580 [Myxococcales bacterium]|nr:hypothetical protein [Myxococcales bacterium]